MHYLSSIYFVSQHSTCFGYICSPSSGGILYIYNNWYVLCFSVDCPLAGLRWNFHLLSPTHRTPLIWHPVTSSYFQKWNWSWKDAGSITLRGSRPNRRECLTLWQKRTSRKRSKNEWDGGTGVYMREGTTSRVTAADRPYGEFYDFYSVSPENFGSTLVYSTPPDDGLHICPKHVECWLTK